MATIRAFRALRPPKENADKVAAVPYDVVNTDEARRLSAGNPLSFLHVSRPEIDLPDGTDIYSDQVYEKAKENFDKLKADAPMALEADLSLYAYRLQMGEHSQTGIAGCCSVDEYDADVIRKHERTRKDKEDDRTRHMVTIRAQTGPVFLTYRGLDEIDEIVAAAQKEEPLYDFQAEDGVRHTLWRIDETVARHLEGEFRRVPLLYIADGHHRAASASRARAQLKAKNPHHTGEEEYNFFLAVLFPADQLRILAYNRVVKDLNGRSAEEFVNELSKHFEVSETDSPAPQSKGEICMYLGGRWRLLKLPEGTTNPLDPIASLDVRVLEERLLDPLLGIKDVRTDKRIDFVGGVRGAAALEQAVDEGRAQVAFSMYPVTVGDLMAVSDAKEIMPPKSTWFEPKLRDGLLSHVI
ncbi:MAG TPA: DUF1015 family protein [Blastocatellia bacterium]|nr:DUF1015 family protein [Blastocatellia bacterium]